MGYFNAYLSPALKGFSDRELESRSTLSRETIRKARHGYLPTLESALELLRLVGLDVQEGVLRLEMDRLREVGLSPILLLPTAQAREQRLLLPVEASVAAEVLNRPAPIESIDDLRRRGGVAVDRGRFAASGYTYGRNGRLTLHVGTGDDSVLRRALELYLVARFQPAPSGQFVELESAPPDLIYEATLFAIFVMFPLPETGTEIAAAAERGVAELLKHQMQRRNTQALDQAAVVHAYELLKQSGLFGAYGAQYRRRIAAYLLPGPTIDGEPGDLD